VPFSSAIDLQALLEELVCLPLIRGRDNLESIFFHQPCGRSMSLCISTSGCRFTPPSQDAEIIVLSMGESPLGLQTQQYEPGNSVHSVHLARSSTDPCAKWVFRKYLCHKVGGGQKRGIEAVWIKDLEADQLPQEPRHQGPGWQF
jgi:hypothetical protein